MINEEFVAFIVKIGSVAANSNFDNDLDRIPTVEFLQTYKTMLEK